MVRHYKFAMMTTQESAGRLRSRPMTTMQQQYAGDLWFFAKADSAAVAAIRMHPEVSLSYGNAERADFVAVAGPARIERDVPQKKRLWSTAVQAYFPEGAESETVVLIQVVPDHGEYWDSNDNKLVQLFSMARAVATGTTPDMGEHQVVEM
jgi:general stress protein 26